MGNIPYSGYNYAPVFIFPDHINVPEEFGVNYIDDNENLKFKLDEYGRYSIIELSKTPFIKYEYFNWEYKGQNIRYKWYYIDDSSVSYRLYLQNDPVPIISGDVEAWTNFAISGYLMYGDNISTPVYSGYFKEETFARVDMLNNPSGWIIEDEPFPVFGSLTKPEFSVLIEEQYEPIQLIVGNDNNIIKGKDITFYKENKIPILDKNLSNNINSLEYYFDGKNLITNYDFSNIDLQKNIHVNYEYTLQEVKVCAKLYTNEKGFSEYTPIIDNYILKLSTQRVNR